MVAYYQHKIADWMDGTESLSDSEYRAYHVICQLIYLHDGPIVSNEAGIAGRCNQHILRFRENLKKLVDKGKIFRTADGKISNRRAETELAKIGSGKRRRRAEPQPDPSHTPRQPQPDPPTTQAQPPGGLSGKPLENKGGDLFGDGLEKRREEKKEDVPPDGGTATAEPPPDERTRLWRDGLATLERITGRPAGPLRSLIGRWLRTMNDDCVGLRRIIEDAAINRAGVPVEWIEGAIRKRVGAGASIRGAAPKAGSAHLALQRFNRENDDGERSGEERRSLPAPHAS